LRVTDIPLGGLSVAVVGPADSEKSLAMTEILS
jgi:hypothetical protein